MSPSTLAGATRSLTVGSLFIAGGLGIAGTALALESPVSLLLLVTVGVERAD